MQERKGAIMMISYRLGLLIETHADTLAAGLRRKWRFVDRAIYFTAVGCQEEVEHPRPQQRELVAAIK